jgi:membrane AbrB-like protein
VALAPVQEHGGTVTAQAQGWAAARGLVACTLGGALCAGVGVPLPWLIGPLFTMAGLKLADVHLAAPPGGRELGQVIIATALGLYFTPAVAREVGGRWELLIAAAVFATVLSYAGAWFISRFSDTDRTTAFFASVPGGATEMAVLGERFGAKQDRIALAQSLRILIVVTAIPFSFAALGVHGSDVHAQGAAPFSLGGLAALLACASAGGFAFQRVRIPNAFMLGALTVGIVLTASGIQWSSMPAVLTNAGQVLLGCALGARFEREFMRRAPRFVVIVTLSVLVAMALSAVFAAVLAHLGGVSVGTMVLATAPGGIAEMCITAKVVQLGVPLVTAAHVARVVMLVTMTAPVFRLGRWVRRRLVTK